MPTSSIQDGAIETPAAIADSVPASVPPDKGVTVGALNGNLYIRRGPDTAFNPIGVLEQGVHVPGLARDVLAKWVQVPVPGQPGTTGWVSIQTEYSSINGDVMRLPVRSIEDWPVAAYLRNCTVHRMLVKPGDTILPPFRAFPDNEAWFYPGHYTIYDQDFPDQPEVLSVDMREGITIDIRIDGSGDRRKCP